MITRSSFLKTCALSLGALFLPRLKKRKEIFDSVRAEIDTRGFVFRFYKGRSLCREIIAGYHPFGPGYEVLPFGGERRIKTFNFCYNIERQDVHIFGNLTEIKDIIIEPPTVTLELEYA